MPEAPSLGLRAERSRQSVSALSPDGRAGGIKRRGPSKSRCSRVGYREVLHDCERAAAMAFAIGPRAGFPCFGDLARSAGGFKSARLGGRMALAQSPDSPRPPGIWGSATVSGVSKALP